MNSTNLEYFWKWFLEKFGEDALNIYQGYETNKLIEYVIEKTRQEILQQEQQKWQEEPIKKVKEMLKNYDEEYQKLLKDYYENIKKFKKIYSYEPDWAKEIMSENDAKKILNEEWCKVLGWNEAIERVLELLKSEIQKGAKENERV
jgi:DNA integrity scanning protein DisA with diadenylate cyclase activity